MDPRLVELLSEMVERGASDLHLTAGERPKLRIDGDLADSRAEDVLHPEDTAALGRSMLSSDQRARFAGEPDFDFGFAIPGLSRFRANLFRQRGSVACAIRRVPAEIPSLRELGVPSVVGRLADKPRGLVLVTGPTGSGKSTTLGGDGRPHQHGSRRPHRDDRGPDRIRTSAQTLYREPARDRARTRPTSPAPSATRCARTPT